MKNALKNQNLLFEDKEIVFLCSRTSKTLSLGEFDESKTHMFLSSIFMNFYGLKVQFNVKS